MCPGQAWRTQSLVFSIPSAPASASASAPASSRPPSGPYRGPATCCLSCPVQSYEPAFSSLSPRSLSRPRLFIWGLTRGLWASGRLSVAVYPASCKRVGKRFFFFVPTRGGFFLLLFSLSLSLRCFLPFFFGAISISLSSALSLPRPASCGYVAAVGGQRANDVYERNVTERNGISVA
jgi:hypothetical protein